ncbi:MAG TPA: hypothetical protein VMU57_06075, partial [Edaphobacter sp.]|uniref:hypothetical protein n=1 Tax=Edaphobacter sp. TaxID=1934404 RepID=UPI002CCCCE1D
GLRRDDAHAALTKESQILHLGSVANPSGFLVRLGAWLPGKDGDQLGAIEPDIIGEAFVVDQLTQLGDQGGASILRASQCRPTKVVQFLIRAAQDFSSAQSTSIVGPLSWLGLVVEKGEADDLGLLRTISNALPSTSVVLRPYALSVRENIDSRLCLLMENKEISAVDFIVEISMLLSDLAHAQHDMGLYPESVITARRASYLFRTLTTFNRTPFLSYLAMTSDNLARMLVSIGSFDEALQSSQEAVGLLRELSAQDPEYLPVLCAYLNTLGIVLRHCGDDDMAAKNLREGADYIVSFRQGCVVTERATAGETFCFGMSLRDAH